MKHAIAVLSVLVTVPMFGWGDVGHRVVAAVAESQLTPNAKAKARALNGGKPLVELAMVADKIKKTTRKETADWHFVDIPLDEDSYDAARDCDEDNCVVPRIEEFRDVLADDGASKTKKKEALLFLVHFVGDIHQPMHATDNDDRGGGGVEFKFGEKKTNLHSIWDSGIISNTAGSESELVKRIKQRIANGEDDATGTAEEWANESHELGKDAYAQVLKSLGGDMKISNKELEEDGHIVEDQLLRASVRLAKALNDALD